jgi:membrane peptidoglycan carboxypeptidase
MLPRPRTAEGGYTRASGTGGRGRVADELDGYGRSPDGRPNGTGRGGQHAQGRTPRGGARDNGGARDSGGTPDSGERPYGRGAADAPRDGRGENGYRGEHGHRSRRDAPDGRTGPDRRDGRRAPSGPGRDERGSRGRDAAQYGNGRRDVRDDVRERLRRNGIGGADGLDGAGGRSRQRPSRYGPGEDGWDDSIVGRLRGRLRSNAAGGADDWDGPDGPLRRRLRKKGPGDGDWDGPGGRSPRRKGSWWRHWSWKKALGVVAAACGVVVIVSAAGVAYAYSKTTIPSIQTAVFQQKSSVYFSDGKTLIGQFGTTDREILNYNQFPAVLRNAVVAAEDKNFWHEGGISPSGIIRAAYYDLTKSGGNLQGASTITQQLVRNYYTNIGTAQTFSRKIKEIFVAEKLAQVKSKQWILQQYLNTIYLGNGAYGVAAAANVYFGLTPSDLSKITPAQAAMIAAMIQSPGYYTANPQGGQAYQALVYRWHYVITAMAGMGTLSSSEAAQLKFPTLAKAVNNSWSGYKGYIMNAVQYELENTYHFSASKIDNGGLRIVTTFNKSLMSSLYATVRKDEKEMKNCAPPAILSAAAPAGCKGLPKWVHVGAVLEQPGTGAILAMYSGANYNKDQYDNALQSRNQVGSSFKPYVLATAVKMGMNVQTSKLDGLSPLWIPPDSNPVTYAKPGGTSPGSAWYEVFNDESGNNNFPGVSVKDATAFSLNTAYTDLWHRVAFDPENNSHPVVNMAAAFGVDTKASGLQTMQDEAGTALGQASLTVEEQATTIATLANDGEYSTPHVIQQITDGSEIIPARIAHRQVLTKDQAADVDWAMDADTQPGGTAAGLGLDNGQTVIAKTGTTNLSQSAFFMGATPKYAMAVGMFVSKPTCPKRLQAECSAVGSLQFAPPAGIQSLFGVGGLSGYGGQYPALLWHDFFNANFDNLPLTQFLPVNDDGTSWNLMGPYAPPKPKKPQHQQQTGSGNPGCGHHHHFPLGPCGGPTPTGNPTPTGSPTPSVSPTGNPTQPPGFGPRHGGTSGGAGAGALALGAVVFAGPSLSVIGRLRDRRRRKAAVPREGPPAS